MELLSLNEMSMLQGDLQKLSLPSTANLYVSLGLPELFRRVDTISARQFENSWLYIPQEHIKSLRQNLIVTGNNLSHSYVSRHSIVIEGYRLYPILLKGKVAGVIVDKSENKLKINKKISSIILDSLKSFEEKITKSDNDIIKKFLSNIHRYNNNLDNFFKFLLKLLTSQYPNSCGAFYHKQKDIYKLRMVVGHLGKYDKFPSKIDTITTQQWDTFIHKNTFWIPAELVPPHPSFLTTPPDFLFIHPGIESELNNYVIVLAVDGDIEYKDMEKIKELANLSSRFHDSQFMNPVELLKLYNILITDSEDSITFDKMLLKLFDLLKKQITLSRLSFMNSKGEMIKVVFPDNKTEQEIIHTSMNENENRIFEELKKEDIIFVSDIGKFNHSEETTQQYQRDNVKSEIYFSIKFPDNSLRVLSIGSPVAGEYLNSYRESLIYHAQFVKHFLMIKNEGKEFNLDFINETIHHKQLLALHRLDTIGKLSEGFYHDIFSLLSVIMVQSEMLSKGMSDGNQILPQKKIESGLEKLNQVADELTFYLNKHKEICTISTRNSAEQVSCNVFLKELPVITKGYIQQIQDLKNISLKIIVETTSGINFSLSLSEIYDYILPLILSVMDHAIVSGTIYVQIRNIQNQDMLVLKSPERIVGDVSFSKIFQGAFPFYKISEYDLQTNNYLLGDITFTGSFDNNGGFQIKIAKQSTMFTEEKSDFKKNKTY